MKKDSRWLVRVETQKKGYLTVHSRHEIFGSENRAWKYVERVTKKHPECKCFIGELKPAEIRQFQLDLSDKEGPLDIDF